MRKLDIVPIVNDYYTQQWISLRVEQLPVSSATASKPKGTKRKKSKDGSRKVCLQLLSRYVRLRDCFAYSPEADKAPCVTCGKIYDYSKLTAGHFVPKGNRSSYDVFQDTNVHAQCVHCNRFLHGNLIPYTLYMLDNYGRKEITRIYENRKVSVKLGDIKTCLKGKIKRIEEKIENANTN